MVKKAKAWSVSTSVGGKFPGVDPVFFKDRQRVALLSALAIKVYQLNTRQMIAKIPVDCTDATQLYLSQDETEFYIVRSSGEVDQVGVTESEVRRYENVEPSAKVARIVTNIGDNLVLLLYSAHGDLELYLSGPGDSSERLLFRATGADLWAVSPSRDFVVFGGRKEGSRIETFQLSTRKAVTKGVRERRSHSLAVSNAGLVAVGASSGVIDMYYTRGVRALKWHLEEVCALQFTLNDEYLLSGGKERVLVLWQLGTEKQQFLPRLDGAITSICCNATSTLYGVTLGGYQLVVLSAVDLVSRLHVAGVKAHFEKLVDQKKKKRKGSHNGSSSSAASEVGDCTTALAVHPSTRHAYLFPGGSQVQVYNPARDEQEAVVALAPALQIGKVRREYQIHDPVATLLEFTRDGVWMITVDVADPPSVDPLLSRSDREYQLKFWKRVDTQPQSKWELVTRVTQPHGVHRAVIALRPHPTSSGEVLTAGDDGGLRLWKLDSKTGQWTLRRVLAGFAITSKSVAVAWAGDSSVVALGFDSQVYLVEMRRFRVVKNMSNVAELRIRALEFVGRYLVVLAKARLSVIDVVAGELVWSIAVRTPAHGGRLLAADSQHGRFALAMNYWAPGYRMAARLVLFDPASPVPLELAVHQHGVGALRLVPGTSSYLVVDTRGVISTLAGTATVSGVEKPTFHNALVSLYSSAPPSTGANGAAATDSLEEPVTKQLDVNSFSSVFDSDNTNLEAVFDRVLNLVAPPY